ncbi:GpE family phage tail protein [Acinetobacter soli]|uniref:GpE family phage tail protein n=1 Tax=Acinetobacter soli TaxID=487316 RepID=UPI00280F0805|nr:GpE family phage tail protein [Acinetobacter soli]MDQ8995180.1 GpE family phage tail protein [Acinetobacter soli]
MRTIRSGTSWWSHYPFFATEVSTCGCITPTVDDAIANIAVVFHWPPQAYTDMSLSQLMQWHQHAIDRNGNDAE